MNNIKSVLNFFVTKKYSECYGLLNEVKEKFGLDFGNDFGKGHGMGQGKGFKK